MIVVSTNRGRVGQVLHGYALSFLKLLAAGSANMHLGPPQSTSTRVQLELQKQSGVSFFSSGMD